MSETVSSSLPPSTALQLGDNLTSTLVIVPDPSYQETLQGERRPNKGIFTFQGGIRRMPPLLHNDLKRCLLASRKEGHKSASSHKKHLCCTRFDFVPLCLDLTDFIKGHLV